MTTVASVAQSDNGNSKAANPYSGSFRSSGVQHFDFTGLVQTPPDAQQPRPQHTQVQHSGDTSTAPLKRLQHSSGGTSQHAQHVSYGIAHSNVGYKLLKKAGWREGTGLGVVEQGLKTPLQPWNQAGRKGIGAAANAAVSKQLAAADDRSQRAAQHASQQATAQQRQERVQQVVNDELQCESLATKLAIHHQAAASQRDAETRRHLRRYFSDAIADDDGAHQRQQHAALQRNVRLRATNPLIDSDDEDDGL